MNPQSILALTQNERFIIEDSRPLADSLEWELGQRYLRERGTKAFFDQNPVPFVINNDGFLSRQAAETLFASLAEAESAGPLEPRIVVLELGIGVGLFARFFLSAFKQLAEQHGKDYYERLVYVAGDRSERMLADACRHGVFAGHAGHYLIRVVDALEPGKYLLGDPSLPRECRQPFRAVFLNYLLDCLPAADLKIEDGAVRQLYVRTCLARNVPLAAYSDLTPQDLARRAKSGTAADHRSLLRLYGLFSAEYEYLPVENDELGMMNDERGMMNDERASGDHSPLTTHHSPIPYLDFAVDFARQNTNHLLHNHGAIRCLEGLLELLHPHGFILMNDYGQTELHQGGDFQHQRFSHATFVGINFPLLKAFFTARGEGTGARGEGTGASGAEGNCYVTASTPPTTHNSPLTTSNSPLTWIEPSEDSGRIHSRLLGHAVGPETARVFAERFSKAAFDWAQEPINAAHGNLQHGVVEGALTAYYQALERQPRNWILMNEIANFLTFTLRKPAAGIAMAKAALALNPACSAQLWNTLGDAWFEIGKVPEAKNAYQRALRVNPADVQARYNLSWVYRHERNFRAALAVIAEALSLDETGEYFDRLRQKEAEVVEELKQRNQHRRFLLANRVSTRAAGSDDKTAK